jgi:hypothetical protein
MTILLYCLFLIHSLLTSVTKPYAVSSDSISRIELSSMLHAQVGECEGRYMQSAFESWMGQNISVRLRLQRVKLTVHGVLLNDQNDNLLVRLDAGPDIKIAKATVLAIEEQGPRSAYVI